MQHTTECGETQTHEKCFYFKELESLLLQTLRCGSINSSEICHISSFTWVNVCGIKAPSLKCAFVGGMKFHPRPVLCLSLSNTCTCGTLQSNAVCWQYPLHGHGFLDNIMPQYTTCQDAKDNLFLICLLSFAPVCLLWPWLLCSSRWLTFSILCHYFETI